MTRATGSGSNKRKMQYASVLLVAVLLLSAGLVIFAHGGSSGSDNDVIAGNGEKSITYHKYQDEGNGEGQHPAVTMVARYYGIAATEYNPTYWKGNVDEPVGTVSNWVGDRVTVNPADVGVNLAGLNGNVSVSYNMSENDGKISIGGIEDISELNSGTEVFRISSDRFDIGVFTTAYYKFDTVIIEVSKPVGEYDIVGKIYSGACSPTDISATGNLNIEFTLDFSKIVVNKVFAGWHTNSTSATNVNADVIEDGIVTTKSNLVYPGDVVPSTVTNLYADWVVPDLFVDNTVQRKDAVTDVVDGVLKTSIMFEGLNPYREIGSLSDAQFTAGTHYTWNGSSYQVSNAKSMFATIYVLNGNVSATSDNLPTGTYRSLNINRPVTIGITAYSLTMGGDVTIDNVNLKQGADCGNRVGSSQGKIIDAKYHRLIVGVGITSLKGHVVNLLGAPSIYGGTNSVTQSIEVDKKIVSESNEALGNTKTKIASYLIIHSGTFCHIAGAGGNVGDNNNPLSTYIVIKKATVIGALYGSASNSDHYGVKDNKYSNPPELDGGSYVYATGLNSVGDRYEDRAVGHEHPDNWYLDESSMVLGGSYSKTLYGSSHLFITGKSSVFDVQGGGRQYDSVTKSTYLEITGKSEVRHVACGTITDGVKDKDRSAADSVHILVDEDPHIGMLFGAGYDTWTMSEYTSMKGGKITIDMKGGTVGFVYGGSMRGTVGTDSMHVDISITISGGTVEYDVFGGGRGGLDKAHHAAYDRDGTQELYINPDGRMGRYDKAGTTGSIGSTNSTGYSRVFGDIVITISGTASIGGSVYGGGESLPAISKLPGFSGSGHALNVATVSGSIQVKIQGGTIAGSVYGAGKGISVDPENSNKVDLSRTFDVPEYDGFKNNQGNMTITSIPYYAAMVQYCGDGFKFIPLIYNNSGASFVTFENYSADYGNYAKVTAKDKMVEDIVVSLGGSHVTVTGGKIGTSLVSASVYGGGQIGLVDAGTKGSSAVVTSVTVNITDGSADKMIYGDVYGGGLGVIDSSSVLGSTSVTISDGNISGSVYGGSKNGVVGGISKNGQNVSITSVSNTSVTITGGSIDCDVFGGGLGEAGKHSVTGSSSVSFSGDEVGGSLYGGAKNGIVSSTSVAITGGSISGSVFGGGLGAAGIISVTNNVHLEISGGTIGTQNNPTGVYGGAENGLIGGNIETVITGGTIYGNAYAGGFGVASNKAVSGTRKLTLKDVTIHGSVYGGSAIGDDGVTGTYDTMVSNSDIIIENGVTVDGSVFGGGFQGHTYGANRIWIGYTNCNDSSKLEVLGVGDNRTITIGGSVFVGGDVGSAAEEQAFIPFSSALAHNGGSIYIYGGGSVDGGSATRIQISISGSIMGSGNSCNTDTHPYVVDGKTYHHTPTSIVLDNFINAVTMESVMRATNVTVIESQISLDGRGTLDVTGETNIYSIYGIDLLTVKGGSIITIQEAVDDIGEYRSLNQDGNPTTSSAPLNKLFFSYGYRYLIRDYDSSHNPPVYGMVTGYSIIELKSAEKAYGGYALGSLESTGGFILMRNGVFTEADKAEYDDDCYLWFITGMMSSSVSMTLTNTGNSPAAKSTDADLEIRKILTTTDLQYVGGDFTPSSADTYTFNQGDISGKQIFTLNIGKNTQGRADEIVMNSGSGVNYSETPLADAIAADREDQPESWTSGHLHLTFSGTIGNTSSYVGYVVLYFQEYTRVDLGGGSYADVITNTVRVTVSLYTVGESSINGKTISITIGTADGSGSSSVTIPSNVQYYSGARVYVTSMTGSGNDGITVQSIKNVNNTSGWTDSIAGTIYHRGDNSQTLVGTLQGAYSALVSFSVTGFTGSPITYTFTMSIEKAGGGTETFTVLVTVQRLPDVEVTFIDDKKGTSSVRSFTFGSYMELVDTPSTEANFIGWYIIESASEEDKKFTKAYDFSTQLTQNIILLARYSYVVTFDRMDGTTSTMYVNQVEGGVKISTIDQGTREGYDAGGWFKDQLCTNQWVDNTDKVTGDITLYAKWTGATIAVTFTYTDPELGLQTLRVDGNPFTYNVTYGGTFGVVDADWSVSHGLSTYLDHAKDILPSAVKVDFIRWSATVNGADTEVYDDTAVNFLRTDGSSSIVLYAVPSKVALKITMEANGGNDLTAQVLCPETFLTYPDLDQGDPQNGYYVIGYALSGASRVGWTLDGWAMVSDGDARYGSGTSIKLHIYSDANGQITKIVEELSNGTIQVILNDGTDGQPVVDGFLQYFKIVTESGTEDVEDFEDLIINNPARMLSITYYAHWDRNQYAVTIIQPSYGHVDAFYGGMAPSSFNAYYGETVTVRFTPDEGYQFIRWIVSGEATLNGNTQSTTFIVGGNCSIMVSAIGPQVVKAYVKYNGGSEDSYLSAYFSVDGTTPDISATFRGWDEDNYAVYSAVVPLGDYHFVLQGGSGTLYDISSFTVQEGTVLTDLSVYTVSSQIKVGNTQDDAGPSTGLTSYTEVVLEGGTVSVTVSPGFNRSITIWQSETQVQFDNISGTGSLILKGSITVITNNVLVHIYKMNIGGNYSVNPEVIYNVNSVQGAGSIDLSAAGYVFTGFNRDTISYSAGMSGTVEGNTLSFTGATDGSVITIEYTRCYATATLNPNTNNVSGNMNAWALEDGIYTKTVWYGESIALPTVSKDGYTFLRWTIGETTITSPYTYEGVDSQPFTIFAVFTNTQYTMTVITPQGLFSNGQSRMDFLYNVGQSLDLATLMAGDWKVNGVNLAQFQLDTENTVVPATMPNHDDTCYLVWIATPYNLSITYDGHVSVGATVDSSSINVVGQVSYGKFVIVSLVFSDGYTLNESSSTLDGKNPVIGVDRQHYTISFTMVSNVTINIESVASQHTISLYLNDEIFNVINVNGNSYDELGWFIMDGYSSSPWYTDRACTVQVDDSVDEGEYYSLYITNPNLNLYTESQGLPYEVHFFNDGVYYSQYDQEFDEYGVWESLNANPFSGGGNRVFAGWAVSQYGNIYYFDEAELELDSYSAVLELHAVWMVKVSSDTLYDGNAHHAEIVLSNLQTATVYYNNVELTDQNYNQVSPNVHVDFVDVIRNGGGNVVPAVTYYYAVLSDIHNQTVGMPGSISFTITPRNLYAVADSHIWTYDGEEHRDSGCTLIGLASTDSYGSSATTAGSAITDIGTVANVLNSVTVTRSSTDVTGNYNITLINGMLSVMADFHSSVNVGVDDCDFVIEINGEDDPVSIEDIEGVSPGDHVRIILNDADIEGGNGIPAIDLYGNGAVNGNYTVTIIVNGDCSLVGGVGADGIRVGSNVTLTIVGSGTLTVAGNGFAENNGNSGSGIGYVDNSVGTIIINTSDLTAYGTGAHAYGIGGNGATVTIMDSVVEANGGSGSTDEFEGGPGIGGATVTIQRSTITAYGGQKAAGIGAMYHRSVAITIEDSNVTSTGGSYSAGIGGSRQPQESEDVSSITVTIAIRHSVIDATGGKYGAGIGSGYDTHCAVKSDKHLYEQGSCVISITNGSDIRARGGLYAADIGSGYHHSNVSGTIDNTVLLFRTIDHVRNTTDAGVDAYYKDSYSIAQVIGFGILDPIREGLWIYDTETGGLTDYTFTVYGVKIRAPTVNSMNENIDTYKAQLEAGTYTYPPA